MSSVTSGSASTAQKPSWASWAGGADTTTTKKSAYLGVGAKPTESMSEETKTSLMEVERRDREMDQVELTRIEEGTTQLKKIALGMNDALKKQTVGLDQLEAGINEHREGVAIANMKLKDAAAKGKKWGGFGRNLMCLAFLMAQIVVLGFMADYLINHRS